MSKSFKTLRYYPSKKSDFTGENTNVVAHNIPITGIYSVCFYIHTQSNNDHGDSLFIAFIVRMRIRR